MFIKGCAKVCLTLGMMVLMAPSAQAEQAGPVNAASDVDTTASAPPRRFVTDRVATIKGKRVRYRAAVEEFFLGDEAGHRTASIFVTSYRRTDLPKDAARPLIFAFNGGPGAASLWLNMGLLSPRRVDLGEADKPQTNPPFRLVDNDDTPLDVADIVMIDPAGTGFSRLLRDGKPEQFYGLQADARATVAIIQQWVRANAAWNAPKFLLSESYGTIRAALVAKLLAGGPTMTGAMEGMTLNGVIMIGQGMALGASGDQAVLTSLPTLAATACFHGKGPGGCTPQGQAEKARRFIEERYLRALWLGSDLPPTERDAIASSLATLTGLPKSTVLDHDLRISAGDFSRELLKSQGLQIGSYDARYTLPLAASGGDPVADDPAMGQYVPAFVAAYKGYAHDELKVTLDIPYEPIAFGAINARWDYGYGPGVFAPINVAPDMATAMRRNPAMRLMIAEGYYDLVTTLGAADYILSHSGIPRDRTAMHYYPSGHMTYLGARTRAMTANDIRAFISN